MKTECPNCHTIFAVTDEHLALADGRVRCGVCDEVFSAIVQDDLFEAPLSETAELLEQDFSEDIAEPIFDETDGDDLDDGSPSPPARDIDTDADNPLFDSPEGNVVPDHIRYDEPHRASFVSTLSWGLIALILCGALVGQYAWYERTTLIHDADLQPYILQACEHIDCGDLGMRAPDKMEMSRRNIYSHPNAEDALMIALTIVNQADFAQAYPDIRIDFSDRVGTVIASRIFSPEEYMQVDAAQLRPLQPETPINITMEVQDPGKHALTYEFEFL